MADMAELARQTRLNLDAQIFGMLLRAGANLAANLGHVSTYNLYVPTNTNVPQLKGEETSIVWFMFVCLQRCGSEMCIYELLMC
jgi:hypothetical protein